MSNLFIKDTHGFKLKPEEAKKTYDVTAVIPMKVEDLENIVVSAIEGGINYWAALDNTDPEWDNKPEGLAVSQYVLELLIAGKSVKFQDAEGSDDDSDWNLTLEKLLNGIALDLRNYQTDLLDIDSEDADRIFQYALLGEIVYG
ncbi:MAG: hypothetical protein FWH03_05525 [Firmicutes bacterium]|nr:hypothetical protein [Bacillota bacterium]